MTAPGDAGDARDAGVTDGVRVVHRGRCRVVLARPAPPPLAPAVEAAVAAAWTAACAARPGLFNGSMLSALAHAAGTLRAGYTEYRRYLAQRARPELYAALGVRPVGVSGLVQTPAGEVLLGRRSARVTQYPGAWEAVPSGSLDGRALGADAPRAGLDLDPTACLRAELEEEAGLGAADVAAVTPLGLFLDVAEDTLDLGYHLQTRLTAAQLRARFAARDRAAEYTDVALVHPAAWDAWRAGVRLVPTTAALWRAGTPPAC